MSNVLLKYLFDLTSVLRFLLALSPLSIFSFLLCSKFFLSHDKNMTENSNLGRVHDLEDKLKKYKIINEELAKELAKKKKQNRKLKKLLAKPTT